MPNLNDVSKSKSEIVNRKDIENSSSSTLSEILDSQPGITSGNQGGIGQTSSYFVQGFEHRQTENRLNFHQ